MILFADSEGADVQSDLGLCCQHMPKDMFLHDAVHLALTDSRCFPENLKFEEKKKQQELCQAGHYTPVASNKM